MKFSKTLLLTLIILITTVICFGFSTHHQFQDNDLNNNLKQLYKQREYFKLKNLLNSSENKIEKWQYLYFKTLVDNVFNRHVESNKNINELFKNYSGQLNDTITSKLLEVRLINSILLFQFKEATETSQKLQKDYKLFLDSIDLADYINEINIWSALTNVPTQTISKTQDTKIQMTKDWIGLWNIPVTVSDSTYDFIFDTGANISTITKSYAKKLGFKILETEFEVGTATNIKVKSGLAIAEKISLGNITYHNVVFLVLPDEALSFPQINYYINGVVGFPMIEAMEEIHITKDHELIVPLKPETKNIQNLAFDGLTPVILGIHKKDSLAFAFDTGAMTTHLYLSYYNKYKKEIDSNYEMRTITIGGAGGSIDVKGFILDDVTLSIGNTITNLDKVRLIAEEIKDKDNYFYGNIGQDVINQFDEMVINFESMYIEFLNK
ncbi:MAG: retropepsin-like domain-containing protein [Ignavibacteria bacterium]|nr:retropepsin-like domain-containing protein [Ignavibacteria bacterium]